jgi:glycosyltransferase involved in cell wall biosynthesis
MDKKIRIALFTNKFPAKVSTFFARDLSILLQYGFNVDVFTTYPIEKRYWVNVPKELRDQIRTETNIIYVNPFYFSYQNIPSEIVQDIQSILSDSLKYGFHQWLKSILVIHQALSWWNQYDGSYDYLLAYWGNYAATYAYLANQLSKSKAPFSFFLRAGTDLYRDQIFLEQKIMRARKIFLPCKFNHEFLRKLYPDTFTSFEDKLVFYFHGPDMENFHFKLYHRPQNIILTIGSLVPRKGFEYAIKALSLLADDFQELHIIMIGDGPEKRRLKRIARSLGLQNRVEFTGWLPFDVVKDYLGKCTLLVHPSIGLGDAVPNVIKEAMASGLPVIGADTVGIPEILDNGRVGLLFPPKDEVALANSIRKLILNPNLREQLSKKARIFVEKKYDMRKNQQSLTSEIESDLDSLFL